MAVAAPGTVSDTGLVYVDGLVSNNKWDTFSSPLTIAFRDDDPLGETFSWLNSEMDAVRSALGTWSNVANIQFTEQAYNSDANIDFFVSDNDGFSKYGWPAGVGGFGVGPTGGAAAPYEDGITAFNFQSPGWDSTGLLQGGKGFQLLLHEIGHAIGLDHPHDDGITNGSTIFPGVTNPFDSGDNDLNQNLFTVMSYNDYLVGQGTNYGYAGTPMALDIAAIQHMYGANMSYMTGDDTYVLPTTNGSGTFGLAIWDAGGIDTISGATATASVTIDLREAPLIGPNAGGFYSWVEGVLGGFVIANGVTIENAIGGSGNDLIIGNQAGNLLTGGAGSDIVDGGDGDDTILATHADGDDTLTGGNGFDILDYTGVNGVVQINQLAGTTTGSAGNDILLDVFERVNGTIFDDVLSGGHGINILDGNDGNDLFFGNNGDDLLRGGNGDDTFYFSTNDGDDRLLGGNGFDILDYSTLFGVVQVNQLAGTTTGTANNDTLLDVFEQVIGTDFGDVLSGGHGINSLNGGGGDDQIFANGGDDWATGGTGTDMITLGPGDDRFQFWDGDGADTLTDFVAGAGTDDQLVLSTVSGATSLAQLLDDGMITQDGPDTILNFGGGDTITLFNVTMADLHSDDFVF